ncbi:MAG: NADH-quinone oxidoreductase subunit N [Acidimicrobiales bacterium]|nr:NADH-quinone oxidoreductase subunit N [Acidimicrobiales bacterium]
MSSLAVVLAQAPQTTVINLAPGAGTPAADPNAPIPTPPVLWAALLPILVLGIGGLVLLTISSLLKKGAPRGFYTLYTVMVAGLSMAAAVPLWAKVNGWTKIAWWDFRDLWWQSLPTEAGPFSTLGQAIGVDGLSVFLILLICIAVILGSLLSDDFLLREGLEGPETYALLLFSACGGVIMAMADDLIVLFLGLETLSIAVYVLAASHLKRAQSQEAGLKYFVLGGFSSAFFLYGIAMLYGATGTTNLVAMKDFLSRSIPANNALLLIGFALLLVGFAFKVAAVPFHAWSPDVYDGAPTPSVAFMASGVKAAGFAGLVRVFVVAFGQYAADWQPIVYALAVLSLVVGSVLAIVQNNVKRTLAYSSVSHVGFILIAVEAATPAGIQAVLFYLASYTFMVVGSFGVVTLVGRVGDGRHSLDDYKGLGRTNPLLAAIFTVFLLAQAGVPFTAGFVAKFYAVIAAVDAGSTVLAVIAMISATIAAFLYLRIIVAMYMTDSDGRSASPVSRAERIRIPFATGLSLLLCVLTTVGVGLLPGPLTELSAKGTPSLVREPARTATDGGLTVGTTGTEAAPGQSQQQG